MNNIYIIIIETYIMQTQWIQIKYNVCLKYKIYILYLI